MEARDMALFVALVTLLIGMLTCLVSQMFAAAFLTFWPFNKLLFLF